MNILSPSLLSIDFNHIERNAKVLDEAGVKMVSLRCYGWNLCTKYLLWTTGY